jgi:hypothetical protein
MSTRLRLVSEVFSERPTVLKCLGNKPPARYRAIAQGSHAVPTCSLSEWYPTRARTSQTASTTTARWFPPRRCGQADIVGLHIVELVEQHLRLGLSPSWPKVTSSRSCRKAACRHGLSLTDDIETRVSEGQQVLIFTAAPTRFIQNLCYCFPVFVGEVGRFNRANEPAH